MSNSVCQIYCAVHHLKMFSFLYWIRKETRYYPQARINFPAEQCSNIISKMVPVVVVCIEHV